MARIFIEGIVDPGFARAGTKSSVGLMLSVTDADGNPYTGLQLQNFQVQLMFDVFNAMDAQVFQFIEENKYPAFREHIPGIYLLSINNVANVWSPTTYTLIVKAEEHRLNATRNQGQTLIQFRVPS